MISLKNLDYHDGTKLKSIVSDSVISSTITMDELHQILKLNFEHGKSVFKETPDGNGDIISLFDKYLRGKNVKDGMELPHLE